MRIFSRVVLAGGLLAALIATEAKAAHEPRYGGILFPQPPGPAGAQRLIWNATPNLKQVEAAMPAQAESAGRTEWRCTIASDGYLHDCRLTAEWPEHQGFGEAARSLLSRFRLSDETVRSSRHNNAAAVFEIDLYNDTYDRIDEIPGDCPVPFCNPVLPPPSLSKN
jgi:hypothetical protein